MEQFEEIILKVNGTAALQKCLCGVYDDYSIRREISF